VNPAGIDVFVPCYNYGRFLRQCTESVLQETRFPIRVLIIDDASTDGSAEEARKIAAEDSRVAVITHSSNQGHIATYNEGIAWVQATYMLLLSADDMVAPGALARAVALMEANPNVAFVYGRAIRFSKVEELKDIQGGIDSAEVAVHHGMEFIRRICSRPDNPVDTATAVVRGIVQKRVGGYCPQLPHSGDLEMWLRCAAHGDVAEIGAVQGFSRMHGANMRDAYYGPQLLRDYRQRQEAFSYFFQNHGGVIPGADQLKQRAFSSLANQLVWEASCAIDHRRPHATLIEFAREVWPNVRWTRPYLKMTIKRVLRALLDYRVRGRSQAAAASRGRP
jgi:glycosyltransferase involved in cell wall biosynthesis